MYAQQRPVEHPQPKHPQNQPRTAKPQRSMSWLMIGGILGSSVLFLLLLVFVVVLYSYSSSGDEIAANVTVAGIDVGGQSHEEAIQTLNAANMAYQPLQLTDGTRNWTVTLADMGVNVDVALTVDMALDAAAGTTVTPWYTIDLNQTQMGLLGLSSQVNVAAVAEPPQKGRAMDVPVMLSRLYSNLSGELADGVMELSMIETDPPVVEDKAKYTGETTSHVVEQGEELGLIARQYGVSVDDIMALNEIDNPDLLYVGQELTIPAAGVYEPPVAEAPAAPTTTGRSLVVSVSDQRIYAYENGQLVHSHLVSTGLPDTPTVLGDYQVYVKYEATDLSGPGYYLPQVPYTMYFYQGYGIHGTYWHNAFGRPMSHGCVNLPVDEAQWFFNFASVGTPVRVIA